MKHPYVFPLLLLFYALNSTAQNDSANRFNVYKSLLQETTTPALIGDNGKHIVHTDARIAINMYGDGTSQLDYLQIGYSTQWRKHGFGIYGNSMGNDFYSQSTAGIQYAFGFEFNKKHKLLANTKIVAATGISITKEEVNFSPLRFGDQIDDQYGFISPTNETPINDKVIYPAVDFGLLIRSSRMFANMALLNVNEPENGMYGSSKKEMRFMLNSGLKLIEYRKFSGWILLDYDYNTISHLGLAAAYQNRYMLSVKMNDNSFWQLRFGYFTPRIRTFIEYGYLDNFQPRSFNSGLLAIGVAAGITKQ